MFVRRKNNKTFLIEVFEWRDFPEDDEYFSREILVGFKKFIEDLKSEKTICKH